MNIYTLPSHATKTRTSGVDFVRVIQPMKHLNGYKGVKTTIYDPKKDEKHNNPTDWFQVMKENDIFYFNYLHNPWGFAAMGMVARKEGVKLVMDIDDAIWLIHNDNPAYSVYGKGTEGIKNFTAICNEVDYITCTNEYLRNVILSNTNKTPDKIKVFPNYIDLKLYKHRVKFKDDGKIMLSWFGSTTHFRDLDDHQFFMGVDRIMKEYPNVSFRTIGAFIPKFRQKWGQRYETVFGHQDIYKWIKKLGHFMDETDILIAPLVDEIYNRSKSDIKYSEASAAKIPGVYKAIRQYEEIIKDGVDGFLASKDTEWYRKIKQLIDDKELRKNMGQAAFKNLEDNKQMKDHLEEYYGFFNEILDKDKK